MTQAASPSPTAVIKLGGSLLGLPDLAVRLANFLGDFSRPRPLLLCGGGQAVEALRRWDRVHNIGEETCHWLSLRTLSITARVVEQILPEISIVDTPSDLATVWSAGRVPIYDAYHFIVDIDEESMSPLPRRWRVTSDSIAARIASHFGAPELILLKSVTLPERISMTEAANEGLVDPHFPTAAKDLERVISVNLCDDDPEESLLYAEPV
jgi:aspartokinase-like uncharacterized kinase